MKTGRPKIDEDRPRLRHVGFKADEDTLRALDALTRAASRPGARASRSVVIRRTLIEAAERLR